MRKETWKVSPGVQDPTHSSSRKEIIKEKSSTELKDTEIQTKKGHPGPNTMNDKVTNMPHVL